MKEKIRKLFSNVWTIPNVLTIIRMLLIPVFVVLFFKGEKIAALCDKMADLLALHTDYSIWESYQRLDAVEKIQNPDFSKTLFENASCRYCRSHQYELARHWYAARARRMAERLAQAVASGDRTAKFSSALR